MAREQKFPCHEWPRESWCDRDGLGGFQGHTCIARGIDQLRRNRNEASEDVRNADLQRREAGIRLNMAIEAIADFEFKYGSQSSGGADGG